MADTKVTDLPLLDEAPADGDQLYVIDVSDTTDDASGSSKRVAASRFVRGTTSGFSVLGKSTTGSGAPASIVASANQVLRRSGSGNLAFGTLVTANIGDQQVTLGKVESISALSVLGRSNSSGSPEVIEAGTAHHVLRRRGGSGVTFGTLDGAQSIDAGSVSNAVLANMTEARIKGRAAGAGTGAPQDLTASQVSDILGPAAIADGSVTTSKITNDAVTNAKLDNMATQRIKGRTSSGTGDPEDLTAAQVQTLLGLAINRKGGSATNWGTEGTSNFTGITSFLIQAGRVSIPDTSGVTVTFPAAYSNTPIVLVSSSVERFVFATSISSSSFHVFPSGSGVVPVSWIAIGPA